MTSLTSTLSTPNSGKSVVPTYAEGSGGFAYGLNALSKGLDIFDSVRKQGAAAKRQQAERAAVRDTALSNLDINTGDYEARQSVVIPSTDISTSIFSDPSGNLVNQQVNDDASEAAKRINKIKIAVDQGRMPQISMEGSYQKELLRLINKHPENVDAIIETFKKSGVPETAFSRSVIDDQKQRTAVVDDRIKLESEAFKKGTEALDPVLLSTLTREEVIKHGLAANHTEYVLNQAKANAELVIQRQGVAEKDKKAAVETRDDAIFQQTLVDANNNFNPVIANIQQISNMIGKVPLARQQAEFERIGGKYDQMASNYKRTAIAKAAAGGMSPDKLSALSAQIDANVNAAKGIWSGEFSNAKRELAAIQSIGTSINVDAAASMPAYFQLKSLGLKPEDIMGMFQGLQGNKEFSDKLRGEFLGLNGKFGEAKASTHLMNIVAILKGQATLSDYDPATARKMMSTLYATSRNAATAYVKGEDVTPDHVLHGIGEVVVAARTLNNSSGLNSLETATVGFAGSVQKQALLKLLKDPVTNDMAEATIAGSRAASAGILQIMKGQMNNYNQGLYTVQFDKANGSYKAVLNKKAFEEARKSAAKPEVSIEGVLRMPVNLKTPAVPVEMQRFINTANLNLHNVVDLGKYDPTTPKATPLELRLFYGAGIVPPSMMKKKEAAINPEKEIDTALGNLQKAFDNIPGMNQDVSVVKTPEDIRAKYKDNPNVELMSSAASNYGVPEEIALRLGDAESGFRPDASSGIAFGLGQVTAKTAKAYGVKNVQDLTPKEQADLSMRILSDNYKRLGNWKDAVSAYHSGVDYVTAERQGRNDGNMSTTDYVRKVHG